MDKYMLKESQTDLLDCSTPEERGYVNGDTTFSLIGWNNIPKRRYFEKSEASINLSALPQELQTQYTDFAKALIHYVWALS